MTPRKLMLLLCLLGLYSALVASQNITITGGLFSAYEFLSVVAANPKATTLAGSTIVTVTFSGASTTGTQIGTITETYVVGPSTAAYTERLPGLSQTDACVFTRSLTRGTCSYESSALNTDSGSIWNYAFETYTLPPADFSLQVSYIVTAGQEKLGSFVTATTTSSAATSPSSNSTAVLAINASTSTVAVAIETGAAITHNTKYLASAAVGLAAVVVAALF